jgi:hypothetical protein
MTVNEMQRNFIQHCHAAAALITDAKSFADVTGQVAKMRKELEQGLAGGAAAAAERPRAPATHVERGRKQTKRKQNATAHATDAARKKNAKANKK